MLLLNLSPSSMFAFDPDAETGRGYDGTWQCTVTSTPGDQHKVRQLAPQLASCFMLNSSLKFDPPRAPSLPPRFPRGPWESSSRFIA